MRSKHKVEIKKASPKTRFFYLAEWTGLEPATPGVTGRYSNQLNYHSIKSAFLYHRYFLQNKECLNYQHSKFNKLETA